jgi:Na+-transporting methylmalonyl-CoA/oxaloacetate decarboxylase beta subunit
MGVGNELFPLLIFVGIGAMTDFGPLLENPKMVLLGGAGQFGIFLTLMLALFLGFTTTRPPRSASSVPSTGPRRSTCRTSSPRSCSRRSRSPPTRT